MRAYPLIFVFLTCLPALEASDDLALHRMFGEDTLSLNALEICKQASRLPAEERFELLARWVLPNAQHPTFRVLGDFHSSNPAPSVNYRTMQETQDHAVSPLIRYLTNKEALALPALELIDAARASGRLNDLKEFLLSCEPHGLEQQRSQTALLFLVDMARKDYESAESIFEQLAILLRGADRRQLPVRWRDVLIMWSTFHDERARQLIEDYFFSHYGDLTQYFPDQRYDVLTDYLRVLHGLSTYLETGRSPDAVVPGSGDRASNWISFGYTSAFDFGHGRPAALWCLEAGRAEKIAGREMDYLAFRSPLRGDYVVECDLSSGASLNSSFITAGIHVEYVDYIKSVRTGNFRKPFQDIILSPPLSPPQHRVRHRSVVQDDKLTHYINGREVRTKPLASEHNPWLAIRSWRRSRGTLHNLRITGRPEIPDEIELTGDPELPGWVPYYEEEFGAADSSWSVVEEPAGNYTISGRYRPELAGSASERLLRYARPMVEDGKIEYDFFYQQSKSMVHPALGRQVFLMRRDGVRIHWLTDGVHDRSGLDPLNAFLEPENQRSPGTLPLRENDWNHVTFKLEGDTVLMSLNGQRVYEGKLNRDGLRQFGLFHYCSRTAARVRNVVWRGDWPKSVPSLKKQQMAAFPLETLNASRDKLPDRFHHDFRTGLPSELFAVEGDETYAEAVERGVRIRRDADSGIHAINACLQMAGDYDIVLTFEDLVIDLPVYLERAGIGVMTQLHNITQDSCAVYRRNGRSSSYQRAAFAHKALQKDGSRWYTGGHLGESASSGRLRLARRGNTVYGLVAEYDSPNYRLIFEHQVPPDDVAVQGLRLITQCHRYLEMSAVFVELDVRAERIYGLPMEKSQPVVQSLAAQQRKLSARKIDLADADSVDENLTLIGQTDHERRHSAAGMRLKLTCAGGSLAARYYSGTTPVPVYDIDVKLQIHQLDTPEVIGQHSEIVLEAMLQRDPQDTLSPIEAALIIRQKANGLRLLVARVYVPQPGGGVRFLPIRSVPVKSPDRLRIAVTNNAMYFLYSDAGSDELKVVAEYPLSRRVSIRNILLNVQASGVDRVTDMTWKSLSIHEQDLPELPLPDVREDD